MIKAIIFDMDGVITDSGDMHFDAWNSVFMKEKGVELDKRDWTKLIGATDLFAVSYFLKKHRIRANHIGWRMKKRRVLWKILKENVRLFPGIKSFIKNMSRRYKVGIATSSWKGTVDIVLRNSGLRPYISKIVAKKDVRNHKPHPEIYQKIANKLGVDEKECVVFEDSVPGVLAAKRAKCWCIAITNSEPASKLRKADLIVKDIRDKRVSSFISSK